METEDEPIQFIEFLQPDIGITVICYDPNEGNVSAFSLAHLVMKNRLSLIENTPMVPMLPIAIVRDLEAATRWMNANGVVWQEEDATKAMNGAAENVGAV